MLKNKLLLSIFTAILIQFSAFIPNSYALKTDRDQPADINRDMLERKSVKTAGRSFYKMYDFRSQQGHSLRVAK